MTRKVLDENYFHISNSGITVSTVEQTYGRDGGYRKWRFEHDLSAFGIGTETTLPLETVQQVETYIGMLESVKQRMLDHYGLTGKNRHGSLNDARPLVIRGLRVEQDWEKTISENSTDVSSRLVGYRLMDKNGVQQEYIPVPDGTHVCSKSSL